MESVEARIFEKLKGVGHEVSEHEPVYTCEEAARIRGVPLSAGTKNMLLKSERGEFILAIVSGEMRVDYKKVADLLGVKKVRNAFPEEVRSEVGCEVGCVPPFGHEKKHRAIIDTRLLINEFIYFNPGVHTKTVKIRPRELLRLLDSPPIKEQIGIRRM